VYLQEIPRATQLAIENYVWSHTEEVDNTRKRSSEILCTISASTL